MERRVCVKSIRNGRFVEFEFSIFDADLSVELIMPIAAFHEFCAAQNAIVSNADLLSMTGEAGPAPQPVAGLYRSPAQHRFPNG